VEDVPGPVWLGCRGWLDPTWQAWIRRGEARLRWNYGEAMPAFAEAPAGEAILRQDYGMVQQY